MPIFRKYFDVFGTRYGILVIPGSQAQLFRGGNLFAQMASCGPLKWPSQFQARPGGNFFKGQIPHFQAQGKKIMPKTHPRGKYFHKFRENNKKLRQDL